MGNPVKNAHSVDVVFAVALFALFAVLSLMLVLIGGDIRPHVVDALQYLVGRIKDQCVSEQELR